MKKTAERWISAAAVAVFYAAMQLVGITCPIRFLTGISCAGCGMTRAWISLLTLHPARVLSFHPLFWVPALWGILWIDRRKIHKKWIKTLFWLSVAALLIVYLVRMGRAADEVVIFRPKEGLIGKSILFAAEQLRQYI